jgi:hypothetical protein
MFPTGLPGLALVLLRLSVAGAILWTCLLIVFPVMPVWTWVMLVTALAALCAGFLTPYVASCAALLNAWVLFSLEAEQKSAVAIFLLAALSLAIIGPGAYSVDARLYGRRRVLIPRD